MSWFTKALSGSIGRKIIMALTGLFLILFLIGHLLGNLQLIYGDAHGFNAYAKFMTTNPAVKLLSYLTYISIIFHAIYALILSINNKKARPVAYSYTNAGANSSWSSRNMGILGTLILIFIVIHMKHFWFNYKFGYTPTATYTLEDGSTETLKDLHTMVVAAFHETWYVVFYVIAMAAVGYHLYHGFKSAFQTLGLRHPKYTPIIKGCGTAFSIIVPALFAIIPIYMYFN